MPRVILRTGFTGPNGSEETLEEYLCDGPDCVNVAVHVLGFVREIGQFVIVCDHHAPPAARRPPDDPGECEPPPGDAR